MTEYQRAMMQVEIAARRVGMQHKVKNDALADAFEAFANEIAKLAQPAPPVFMPPRSKPYDQP